MWTAENRARYDRSKLRYPTDLTDDGWALVEPVDPLRGSTPPAKRGGNKRTVVVREVVNGLMYILGTGCQWAALPKDLPPRSTVNGCFLRWQHDRTLDRLRHALAVSRAGKPRGESDGRHRHAKARAGHRQPERQERGNRGRSDPPGGKQIR